MELSYGRGTDIFASECNIDRVSLRLSESMRDEGLRPSRSKNHIETLLEVLYSKRPQRTFEVLNPSPTSQSKLNINENSRESLQDRTTTEHHVKSQLEMQLENDLRKLNAFTRDLRSAKPRLTTAHSRFKSLASGIGHEMACGPRPKTYESVVKTLSIEFQKFS